MTLVLELDPSLQDVHKLKGSLVHVRLTREFFSRCSANHMSIDSSFRGLFDSEITVFVERTESALELGILGVRRNEALRGHE